MNKLILLGLVTSIFMFSACPMQKGDAHKQTMNKPTAEGQASTWLNYHRPLTEILPKGFQSSELVISIDKSAYTLTLKHNGQAMKTYPVVFGFGYGPDKRMEGDGATPEGRFKIRNLYPHPRWSKFIWIDYPTAESHAKHAAAKAAGDIPNDATVGSEIGIHGVPNDDNGLIDRKENWTAGCISLKNADVDEIYSVLSKGVEVDIQP